MRVFDWLVFSVKRVLEQRTTVCAALQAGAVHELLSKALLYSLLNRIKVSRTFGRLVLVSTFKSLHALHSCGPD